MARGGHAEFLAAIDDPDHAEHEEFLEWIGGGFDPAGFDVAEVNNAFELTAWIPLAVRSPRAAAPAPSSPAR